MKLLIGADPELFVSENGKLVSCHGLLPGTKLNPHRVDKGAVQVDGMAAEFNIDPASNEEEFITNLNTVQNSLRELLGGRSLEAIPVAQFIRMNVKMLIWQKVTLTLSVLVALKTQI